MRTQCRASPGMVMAACWPQSARYVRCTRITIGVISVVIMRQHETLGVVLQDNKEKKLHMFDPRANSSSGVSPRVPSLKEPLQ